MDEFFPEHKESAQVTNKKRRAEKQPIDDDLRNKARFYCTCPEQWRSVSRYSAERLAQFVQENEFKEQQHLQNQVFDFVQRGLGYLIDKFSGANGFVSEQIENDQSLRSAIQAEAGNFVSLLNNKVKLLALLATDTMTGKLNQNLREPQIVEITQEIKNGNDAPIFFGQAPRQEETTMSTGGTLPGDPVCNEAFGNVSGGTQGDGQVTDDCLDVERPEGTEVDLR
jgi:hypothetical protein